MQRFVLALGLMAASVVAAYANPGFDRDSGAARIVTVELERDGQLYRAACAYCWRPPGHDRAGGEC